MQEVLDAVKTLLTGATVAESRIFGHPEEVVWEDTEVPALLVYLVQESPTIWQVSPRTYNRRAQVAVEGVAERAGAGESAPDKVLAFHAEVQAVLLPNPILKTDPAQKLGPAADSRWVRTEYGYDQAGRRLRGAFRFVLEVDFYEEYPEADHQALPDLDTAHADWDLPPPDGQAEAQDDVAIPQE